MSACPKHMALMKTQLESSVLKLEYFCSLYKIVSDYIKIYFGAGNQAVQINEKASMSYSVYLLVFLCSTALKPSSDAAHFIFAFRALVPNHHAQAKTK